MEKKKLNYKTVLVASALFIAIFAQVGFLGSVMGPAGQQHNIWGVSSKVGDDFPGVDIDSNRTITAWIDGVSYGYNWTESTGEYDLYIDGDDWGVDPDNLVKDGGYDGDTIYYFLDYDPMNYFLDISSTTSTFIDGGYENVAPIFFDTRTDQDYFGDLVLDDTYLRGLKINEVVTTPGDGYPQYVILYDTGGDLSESTIEGNYYLEKDDDVAHDPQGPIFDFSLNTQYVAAYGPGLNYYFINLTGFSLDSEDELKLVWENPGTTDDNICNGTDVIVDRVEWGDYQNYINPVTPPDDRDYDNTTMGDYPDAPGTGESIIRSTNGTDTDHCDADFTLQGIASPRPLDYTPPPPVAYIQIRTASGGLGINLCDPGNYPSYAVGYSTTFYGAAYSAAGAYLGDIEVTSTWDSSDTNIVSVAPLTGTQTTVTCDNQNWGTVTITLDDGLGHVNTTQVTVLQPTVDYITIVNTVGTGAAEILDQGVSGGFTIEGWAAGFNNTAGYLNDVSVTWSVTNITSVATTAPLSGVSSIFDAGGVAGTATWEADDGAGHTDTVVFTITISGGVPGAPTDLQVHKGGGVWGGIAGDIVLEWFAPASDYGNLTLNIVYYDMDITDGFQYTNWVLFTPNNTGAGTPDGCILPGWDADSNNYAFIVRTTGDTQGGLENPVGTNVGYKYGIDLLKNAGTSQMFLSIPYISDWSKASDISGPGTEFTDGSIISAVLKWNYTTQNFDSRLWYGPPFNVWSGDFAINPGDAIAIGIVTAAPYTWNILGSHDDTFEFTFLKNAGTSQMFTSIPYHKLYDVASDISGAGAEFTDGTIITAVLQWNYTKQNFDYRTWYGPPFNVWSGEFALDTSPGCHLAFGISAATPYPWQPQTMGL